MLGLFRDAWASHWGQCDLAALETHFDLSTVLFLRVFRKLVDELGVEVIQQKQPSTLFKVDLVLHATKELYRLLENALGV